MNSELLRVVDEIHRSRSIDKELLFEGIESALISAVRKRFGHENDITVTIDRTTGEIKATDGDQPIAPEELGRIAALTAKQVMIQKIREAERDVVYDEYIRRVGQVIVGKVLRYEKPNYIIELRSGGEGLLPAREQIRSEVYQNGETVKLFVLDVRKVGQRVKVILSRSHPELLRHLFEEEVPEIKEYRIIEIKGIARDPGHRAKVAVYSNDSKVDCVGACVGIRGSRIRAIVEELSGEKIDIVRWDESPDMYLQNSLRPAELLMLNLDWEEHRASVFVEEDQLSLAIGRRGMNVRLAAKLTGWDITLFSGTSATDESRKFITDERAKAARLAQRRGEPLPAQMGGPSAGGTLSKEAAAARLFGDDGSPWKAPGENKITADQLFGDSTSPWTPPTPSDGSSPSPWTPPPVSPSVDSLWSPPPSAGPVSPTQVSDSLYRDLEKSDAGEETAETAETTESVESTED